jgi:zinc transport system substrate-binding protein
MRFFTALIIAAFSLSAAAATHSPNVVVSIKPIHSLVCGIMKGIGQPTLLMDGVASPHVYALKPGEASQLEGAALIIWVGPSYETVMQKKMAVIDNPKKVLTLMGIDGLVLYTNRSDGLWGDGHDHHHHHHHGEEHLESHEMDGHIWLAPNNARLIVAAITSELSKIDPVHAKRYEKNAMTVLQQIDDLAQELMAIVEPVRKKSYIVFHDATQYFDRYFGTAAVGAIVMEPDIPPTPHHLKKLTEYLKKERDVCLFMEPQFDNKLVKQLATDTGQTVYKLDYLGSDLDADEQCYFDMMRRFAVALASGLSGKSIENDLAKGGECAKHKRKDCCEKGCCS